jgi:hypothetical protein
LRFWQLRETTRFLFWPVSWFGFQKVLSNDLSAFQHVLQGGFVGLENETTTNVLMQSKTKPIHEVRLGHTKAAVWKNETEAGVRYNVTFSRIYKDGDNWKSTDSFGRDDLLVLGKVADQAHSWIFAQGQEEDNGTKAAPKR